MTTGKQPQQVGNAELVELRERAALPFRAERLGLQALAAAIRARVVGPIAREKDAHVHLVGVLLEPAEEALEAIPKLRPRLAVFFAVAGLAVDDETLLLQRQRRERHIGWNLFLSRENEQ